MTRSEYKRRWLRQRRQAVKAYKLSVGCANGCKVSKSNELHFHHIDPATKCKANHDNSLAYVYHREKLQRDCIVLCHDCHKKTESYGKGR